MAQQRNAGICAYCGEHADALTEDHVFARALSGNVEAKAARKWIVPACPPCNNRYSAAEREVLVSFGLTAEVDDELMGDVAARAIRSISPRAGKTDKDRRHRALAQQAMRDRVLSWDVVDKHPNSILLGDLKNADRDRQAAIRVPGAAVRTFGEKLIRGVFFVATGRPVPKRSAVTVKPWQGGTPYERQLAGGDEFRIARSARARCAFSPQDSSFGVFEVVVWEGRVRFSGCVVPESIAS